MVFTTKKLGTEIRIDVPSSFFSLCETELERIETKFSRFKSDSELSKLNLKIHEWQSIDSEFVTILKKAEELFLKTKGAFSIGLQKQLEENGYDANYSFKEASNKTKPTSALPFELKGNKVKLFVPIEIGGFGKGYAADMISRLLNEKAHNEYVINIGGDILMGREMRPILLEHPDDSKKALGQVYLMDNAIASSSSNRRTWGKGKHHILNAQTGESSSEIKAVWVVCDTCLEADAYATALHSLAFSDACDLATQLELDTVIISAENKMFSTNDFVQWFT